MADWSAIKREYVTTSVTYKDLADKHGVSRSMLMQKGAAEKWRNDRKKYQKKVEEKSLNKLARKQADIREEYISAGTALLRKVAKSIALIPEEDVDSQRKISATLKDIKDILSVKSAAEQREQEARIRNLENQVEQAIGNNDITIRIEGEAEEYAQ